MSDRNASEESAARVRVDDLRIDLHHRRVVRHGKAIRLPALSFELLAALVRHAPEAVSFDRLISEVWSGRVVNEETVTQRVRLLRRALDDHGREPRYVESVRGHGYRLIPAVESDGGPRVATRLMPALLGAAAIAAMAVVAFAVRTPERSGTMAVSAPTTGELTRKAWSYFRRHQRQGNEIALDLFRHVLAAEPGNVHALAGLSMTLSQRATKFNYPVDQAERAEELARQALGIAPESFEARLALATALDARGRLGSALQAYENALELQPDDPGALSSAGYLYQVSGRLSRALQYDLRARATGAELAYVDLQIGQTLRLLGFGPAGEPFLVRTDMLGPDNVFAAVARTRFLYASGRFEEAGAVIDQALDRGVARAELYVYRGMLALQRSDTSGAALAFERAARVRGDGGEARTWNIVTARLAGRGSGEAYRQRVAALEAARRDGEDWPDVSLELLTLHAAFGQTANAERELGRLDRAGFRDTALLLVWPGLGELRERPAFQDTIQHMQSEVARERNEVLSAPWLPDGLLSPRGLEAPVARSP